MATCVRNNPAPVPPPPPTYTLELNEAEVRLLYRLLYSHVAGAGAKPLHDIHGALSRAGVRPAKAIGVPGLGRAVVQFDAI